MCIFLFQIKGDNEFKILQIRNNDKIKSNSHELN